MQKARLLSHRANKRRTRQNSVFLYFIGNDDFSVGFFELSYTLSYKIKYLPVCRATLIFCNVVELVMKLRVNLYPEVLVLFISHIITFKSVFVTGAEQFFNSLFELFVLLRRPFVRAFEPAARKTDFF